MHDLPIIERQLINTSGVNNLALLLETAMTNTIYLIKPKQLYIYKSLVLYFNKEVITLNDSTNIAVLKDLNNRSKLVTRAVITGYNGYIIDLSHDEIIGLRGFKLINHMELAIEYYKSTIYDILYTPDLVSLCLTNPKLDNTYSVNILEEIDATPSICLTDDVIDQINNELILNPDIKNQIGLDITPIRNIMNKYMYNPKEFTVSRYTIKIHILEDIRIIRFNELINRSDVDDNEDSSGVYLKL